MYPPKSTNAGTIRLLLKSATAEQHARVDARFAPLLANGEASYAEFLRASARAVYPLERALDAADVTKILPDWNERARSEALRADLAALDVGGPADDVPPAIDSEGYLFGVLYVLEGSRLGAKFLTRTVLTGATERMRGATRYLRHGEGKPLWPTFLQRLESSIAVKRAPADAVAGAQFAFACFGAETKLSGETGDAR
jgi:heme oxygenase